MAATPLVLISGARVPLAPPDQPWQPFDQQGFAAYRLSMEVFSAFILLAVYSVLSLLVRPRFALFGLLVAASTPFLIHETYFTWPKLLAAGVGLLAAQQLLSRRYVWCGLLVGTAYLLHPVGVFALTGLVPLWLILNWRRRVNRQTVHALVGLAMLLGALATVVAFWELINYGHDTQSGFIEYFLQANGKPTNVTGWVNARLRILSDTLIPFHQVLTNDMLEYTFPPGKLAPIAVRLFLGYWWTLPLGMGVLFYPIFILSIGKGILRHPYVTLGCVLVPFLAFVVYWGSFTIGLPAQGLQPWTLGAISIYAWVRAQPGWWPTRLERWLLVSRLPEIGLMIVFPGAWESRRLISADYPITDIAGLTMIAAGILGLLAIIWILPGRSEDSTVAPAGGPVQPAVNASA